MQTKAVDFELPVIILLVVIASFFMAFTKPPVQVIGVLILLALFSYPVVQVRRKRHAKKHREHQRAESLAQSSPNPKLGRSQNIPSLTQGVLSTLGASIKNHWNKFIQSLIHVLSLLVPVRNSSPGGIEDLQVEPLSVRGLEASKEHRDEPSPKLLFEVESEASINKEEVRAKGLAGDLRRSGLEERSSELDRSGTLFPKNFRMEGDKLIIQVSYSYRTQRDTGEKSSKAFKEDHSLRENIDDLGSVLGKRNGGEIRR